ncbi:hypothetical protein G7Y89_g5754 [Cudoniella acicularis]|uniref:Alcohol acetyltransferase n=1 Tax=Cudoniella acicularis TaxID=354080 RepID=A0A8H4RP24_9HELO|nr:hypothetical protein G7Y89_g5754 [Cudoniella acicularis]
MTRAVGNFTVRERFSTVRHNQGTYRCVCITARYITPSAPEDLVSTLEATLGKVILQHAALCCGIINEDKEDPHFVRLESIDVSKCIEYQNLKVTSTEEHEQGLVEILERRHSTLWPNLHLLPGWKLIIVQSPALSSTGTTFDAVFAVHHAFCDGLSAMVFHRSLLSALNSRASSTPSLKNHILTIPSTVVLSPPVEKCVDFKVSWFYIIQQLWNEFMPRLPFLPALPVAWTSTIPSLTSLKNYKSRVKIFHIPAPFVPNILSECRKHNTTLTGLIHALTTLSLAQDIPTAETFTSTTPFSLRYLTGLSPTSEMGVQVSAFETTYPPALISSLRSQHVSPSQLAETLWHFARTFKSDLSAEIASLPNNNQLGMIPYISSMHDFIRKKFGKKRGATYEVSNVGVFKNENEEGMWKIERADFTQSGSAVGPGVGLSVVSVAGGQLSVSLDWLEGDMDEAVLESLKSDLENGLRGIGEGREVGRW